jgi:hypothetical protein
VVVAQKVTETIDGLRERRQRLRCQRPEEVEAGLCTSLVGARPSPLTYAEARGDKKGRAL